MAEVRARAAAICALLLAEPEAFAFDFAAGVLAAGEPFLETDFVAEADFLLVALRLNRR
ncbi:MAG: hypothetical protein ACF788_10890 [Novipirellula sp. JB048]